MSKDSIPKTAIITPFGVFEFLCMPFGVRNAGATFQKLIDTVLANIPSVFCYMDDILVYSSNIQEHTADVRDVLLRLRSAGLRVNPTKSTFFSTQVNFLDHKISADGISPLKENVARLLKFKKPADKSSLRHFLRLLNFYRPFLHGLASLV